MTELSGILNLALKGYQRIVRNGYIFSSQKESDKIIREILRFDNPFRSFVREKIEYSYGNRLSYSKINRAYVEWCNANGITTERANDGFDMHKRMDGRDIFKEINTLYNVERYKSNGERGIKSVCLKQSDE
ncbi:MAG: hypothetical protein ACI4EK_09000 [Wujia sp.]